MPKRDVKTESGRVGGAGRSDYELMEQILGYDNASKRDRSLGCRVGIGKFRV